MSTKQKINDLIDKIYQAHAAGQFPDYIEHIRFPFYKNLTENARIDFNFPITMLTGINGSGKSSVLQAIYGAPEGYSTGNFWFTTSLDPIESSTRKRGEIPSFIYGYKINQNLAEVIKRRSGSAKGADYWEPSRPILMYGMSALEDDKRHPTISKKVIYLDFRSELSAFDKYFHFGSLNRTKTHKTKQDVLRKYSKYVKDALNSGSPSKVYTRKSDVPLDFGVNAVEILSKILGKSYKYCKIIFHNLYGNDGATVIFGTNNLHYSEAFAGRGEFAIAKLIYEIIKASEGSLIILDEPEVSLHPGAQEQLKLFLLKSCLKKKLQIVISTHSPKLIEYLPNKAIKLFYENQNGKFDIINECSYLEAFQSLGADINDSHYKTIIVEDITAKTILEEVINSIGGDYPLIFRVTFYPGGAENMYKKAVIYCEENESQKFIFLDGDKKKIIIDPNDFTATQLNDFNFLDLKLVEETSMNFARLGFRIDGNAKGGDPDQKKASSIKYLKYLATNLNYFPLNIPEEIIWNENYANALLSASKKEMPTGIYDYKLKFHKFTELFMGSSEATNIIAVHKMFIKNFIIVQNKSYHDLKEILAKFKS